MELVVMVYYKVENGDTFTGIAEKFFSHKDREPAVFAGLSKLISLNTEFMEGGSRDRDIIYVGELIRIK